MNSPGLGGLLFLRHAWMAKRSPEPACDSLGRAAREPGASLKGLYPAIRLIIFKRTIRHIWHRSYEVSNVQLFTTQSLWLFVTFNAMTIFLLELKRLGGWGVGGGAWASFTVWMYCRDTDAYITMQRLYFTCSDTLGVFFQAVRTCVATSQGLDRQASS